MTDERFPSSLPPDAGRGPAVLPIVTGLAALALLAVLALLRWSGDRWWPGTLLMYAPRWPWLTLPLALAIAAGLRRRFRLWPAHAAMAAVVLGPIMGLHLPVSRWLSPHSDDDGTWLRVMTCNVGADALDVPAVIDLIERDRIDLVLFQEIETRPLPELDAYFALWGWSVNGRRTIASRHPIVDETPHADYPWKRPHFWGPRLDRARLRLPSGREIDALSVHLPTIRFGLSLALAGDTAGLQAHIDWRREQLRHLLRDAEPEPGVPMILGGDLNAPSDSLLLDPLRARFLFSGDRSSLGYLYTRPAAFPWIGIDHVLCTPDCLPLSSFAGPRVGSDHRPLISTIHVPPTARLVPSEGPPLQ